MLSKRILLPGIFACALAARLTFAWMMPAQPPSGPLADPDQYVALGASFAGTWTLFEDGKPSAHREPVYPMILGLVFRGVGVSYAGVLAANTLLGILSLGLMILIGKELQEESAGLVAAAIGAFYPTFLYYNSQAFRETCIAFWALLTLWLLLRACGNASVGRFAAAGAAAAMGSLTKTTFFPFSLFLVPIGVFFLFRRRRTPPWRWLSGYLIVFLLCYCAWPIRNYFALGKFILGATEGGGNNLYIYQVVPQELGGTAMGTEIIKQDPVCQVAGSLSPVEKDRFFWRAGLGRVLSHPWNYAKLVAWRFFVDFWRILPRVRVHETSSRMIRLASLLSDGWIVPLGLAGVLFARFQAPGALWLYLFLFSEAFVYSLIFTMIRYRFATMPVLILFAALCLCRGWDKVRRLFWT